MTLRVGVYREPGAALADGQHAALVGGVLDLAGLAAFAENH